MHVCHNCTLASDVMTYLGRSANSTVVTRPLNEQVLIPYQQWVSPLLIVNSSTKVITLETAAQNTCISLHGHQQNSA